MKNTNTKFDILKNHYPGLSDDQINDYLNSQNDLKKAKKDQIAKKDQKSSNDKQK